ncbi:diguanylate cyclase [Actinoplanes sp. NPDC049265]|uniref:tetratricopeptide repeat-containing diguanylate cyclase n=1 Tax=Actinoplanes sp. NPDC049265 TaxID=3363902 RepID=UPI003718C576
MPLPVPADSHGVLFGCALEVHNLTMNGRHHEALVLGDRAEAVLLTLGDRPAYLLARQARMYALLGLGRLNEALSISEELAAARRVSGPRANYVKILADQADLYVKLGRTDEGLHLLARAITELELLPHQGRYFSALCSISDAALAAELYELADRCARDSGADPVFQESLRLMHAEMLLEWGMRLQQLGAAGEARSRLTRSVELAREHRALDPDAPVVVALLAVGLARTGRPGEAIELAEEHLLPLRAQGLRHEARLLHIAYGSALHELGDPRGAFRELTAALELSEQTGQRLIIRYELARIAAAMDPGAAATTMLDTLRDQLALLWRQRLDRRQMLRQARRRAELEAARDRAEDVAVSDALTGLGNRRAFDARLGRTGRGTALILVDVDHFKDINDTYSHGVGDRVLHAVADVLRAHCRQGEAAVRFGGDEFAVFLDADLPTAAAIARRVRAAVRGYDWNTLMPGLRVTLSIGAAVWTDGMRGPDLFDQADRQLYAAKRQGRDLVVA